MFSYSDNAGVPNLAPILKCLMSAHTRGTEANRERLANHPDTHKLLEAGMRLIANELGVGTVSALRRSNKEADRPFFKWITLEGLIAEAARQDPELTIGKFRDRWPTRGDYIDDLMAYALWSHHWASHTAVADKAVGLLAGDHDFVDAIKQVAYDDLDVIMDDPAQRIAMIAAAVASQDETARAGRAELYAMVRDNWGVLYAATLKARGLQLRSDVSLHDLTNILTALAEGLTLRGIADSDTIVIDHTARDSLLGKAALVITAGCIDTGDGLTVEETVRQLERP